MSLHLPSSLLLAWLAVVPGPAAALTAPPPAEQAPAASASSPRIGPGPLEADGADAPSGTARPAHAASQEPSTTDSGGKREHASPPQEGAAPPGEPIAAEPADAPSEPSRAAASEAQGRHTLAEKVDASSPPAAPPAQVVCTEPHRLPLVKPAFSYSLNPIYPLWEGTGYALKEGEVYVGSAFVQVSLIDRLHIGIRPLSYFFRAPNAHLKWGFFDGHTKNGQPLSAAVQLEAVMLLRGASEAFTSTNFVSRLDNAESDLTVIPVSGSVSWALRPWLNLHATTTLTTVMGGRTFKTKGTLGTVFAAELAAPTRHSLFFHAGEVGFWDHDFSLFGASYRYQLGVFEARVGYLFRFTEEGRQGAPLLSLGLHL